MSKMSTLDMEIRRLLCGISIAKDALQDMEADGHRDHRLSTSMTHLTVAVITLRMLLDHGSDDDEQ